MEPKRITCPETGYLEDVELERAPLGLVVTGCSRFRNGELACRRECTKRMDQRERTESDRERVMIVVANMHDDAARVATMLAAELATDDVVVELAELGARSVPPVEDYDAVVVGAHVHLGRHDGAAIAYIREHRKALEAVPTFFYSTAAHDVCDHEALARRMTRRTGWRPTLSVSFTGAHALHRSELRAFARQIADELPAIQPQTMA